MIRASCAGSLVRPFNAGCIVALALALVLGASTLVFAQPAKVYKIGWLAAGSPPGGADRNNADFSKGLRDAGYVEGQNLTIEYRFANGDPARLSEMAADLIRLRVDLIVTSGEPAALAAKRATDTIPIVVTETGLDPVKAGLVTSLPRPGGNVTGLATMSEELWPRRVGTLKAIAPKLARLAVLFNPSNAGNASCLQEIQDASRTMGVQVRPYDVRDRRSLESAFVAMAADLPGGIAVCWDSATLENARPIAEFALKYRLPTMTPLKEFVVAGCLISYGPNLPAHRRSAVSYVSRILKGAKAADLPVEQPKDFPLVVNTDTIRAIGAVIPPAVEFSITDMVP